MPKSFSRLTRIGDQIQRELADLIRLEVKDPRVGMATITAVQVSADHSQAKVFVTSLRDEAGLQQTLEGLNRAAGFLRTALFHRLKLKVVPTLVFLRDDSIERGVRLSSLIDRAVAEDEAKKTGE